ncbi:MAG: type II toxin-antitoxin system VapC family toxin [Gammaproteobacteria bacterium]|nr:type II toxin-antitoxin system VapC family toxin [Gammaproteobacteria bacterium]
MTDFVLDNSVAMRWLLESEKASDQKYAENVLNSLKKHDAVAPGLWPLEAVSVLLGAEKRVEVSLGEIERFISQLENLPIHIDPLTAHQAFSRTLALARAYNISSYDASYLELAMREGLPLASLDNKLVKVARKADIGIYMKSD